MRQNSKIQDLTPKHQESRPDPLPLIAVVGPTASGKSAMADTLAQAVGGELVCADSRQLYRGMTIGTAKDEGEWRDIGGVSRFVLPSGTIEHLVDFLNPDEDFSASDFQRLAFETIDDMHVRGVVPILVGGTGLYVQAVVDHLTFPDVAPNEEIRRRLEAKSLDDLRCMYAAGDPIGAASIDEQNKRRLVRAIEVCLITRQPFSSLQTKGEPRYETLQLGVELFREALYQRINRRVVEMMERGFVDEVRRLLDSGVDPTSTAMTGIGYKEIVDYLQGDISVNEVVAMMQRNTRRLAKRQLTWFKHDARIHWVRDAVEALPLVRAFL